jgi:hypothetical protein
MVQPRCVRLPGTALALACALALVTSACSGLGLGVRPWQRERLASPAMAGPLAQTPMMVGYRAKLLESKTGGGLPGVPAGGGCGCTQ